MLFAVRRLVTRMGLVAIALAGAAFWSPLFASPTSTRAVVARDARRPGSHSGVHGTGVQTRDALAYKLSAGPWPVRMVDRLVLKDERRRKNVEMTVRYPGVKGAGRVTAFPLIVFSHERGGSRKAFPDLCTYWASHGYVVIVPTHDDPAGAVRPGQNRAPFDERQLDRLADLVFVLDSLPRIEKDLDGFHGWHAAHIDRTRMGVAGFAAGALTAQMAVGVKVRLSQGGDLDLKSVGDHRFRAAVLISCQGTINRMLTRESWDDLTRPLLVVTGSKDVTPASRETPESRQEPFLLARPGQKYLLFIDGATHASFEGRPAGTRPLAGVTAADTREISDAEARMVAAATASTTLAFWDAHLLDDEHGREYLASDAVTKFSGGKARLQRR